MPNNKGKAFEARFKQNWQASFPNGFLLRLQDQMSGYKITSQNPCDFVCFNSGVLYLIELKSHLGNTFPLSNLTQYDKLEPKSRIPGVRAGVIIWFVDHDKVAYVPITSIRRMKEDGKKSVNVKMLEDGSYNILKIPSVKKRVFMESDYSVMKTLVDGE